MMTNQPSYRRLRGRWLLVARVVWLALTAVSLGLFALSLAPGYRLLRTVCVREETDLEQLSGTLISVVEMTVQPEHVSLWLRGRDRGRQK